MPKNNKWQMPAEEKSLDQWVVDTISPILIIIYEIMEQIITGLMEFESHVN